MTASLKCPDFVKETTTIMGTSDILLAGAVLNWRTFSSQLSDGDTFPYSVYTQDGSSAETGWGTYHSSTNSFTRTLVTSSTNSNLLVNLPFGIKVVTCGPQGTNLVQENHSFSNIANLRLNTLLWNYVKVNGYFNANDGGQGLFMYIPSDTTSSDNGGTIIIDAAGHRFYRIFTGPITLSMFGAFPTSIDPTFAIQTAINTGLLNNIPVADSIGGQYNITSTLFFNSPHDIRGWKFSGYFQGNDGTGTSFRLKGTGFNAIMQYNPQGHIHRNIQFENFRLETDSDRGATYGFLFASTEFSQMYFKKVSVGKADGGTGGNYGPVTAFGILAGTGTNGEFTHFMDCTATNVDSVFYSNAGQAYMQRFDHLIASVNFGGVYFNLDYSGGGGLIVTDMNGTTSTVNGFSNSLLVSDRGNSSSIKFLGGRMEFITQLYYNTGTGSASGTVEFDSMNVVIDFDPTNGTNTKTSVVRYTGSASIVKFNNMNFSTAKAGIQFPIDLSGSVGSKILFNACLFGQTNPPYLIGMGQYNNSVLIRESRITMSGDDPFAGGSGRKVPLDRSWTNGEYSPGKRDVNGDSAWTPGGIPEQLIIYPEVANGSSSANVTPLSPWTVTGNSTVIAQVTEWSTAGQAYYNLPVSSLPTARHISLNPNTGIQQILTSVDLSTNNISRYDKSGARYSSLTWTVFFDSASGTANAGYLKLSMIDSVNNYVYDQKFIDHEFYGAVVLSDAVKQPSNTSYPIIKIENVSNASFAFNMKYQYFHTNLKGALAMYGNAGEAQGDILLTTGLPESWGMTTDNALITHRLAIPHKPDKYGSAAVKPLTNIISDVYLSTDDERRTYYASGKWWKDPRITYGTVAPVAGGPYVVGDQVLNSVPASGGFLGWVCTVAGSPGTWKTFGLIS